MYSCRAVKFMVAAVFVLCSGRAFAQEIQLGEAGHAAISAERLFGFVHTSQTTTIAGMDTSRSNDSFSLFSNPLGGIASGYAWPRVAVDFFVAQGLSVGGAAGFFHVSASNSTASNTSIDGFLLAPRLGYAAQLGPKVLIWPRVGITYEHLSTGGGTGSVSNKASALALTIEAPLAIVVSSHVAILLGPTFDLGLSGSNSSGGTSVDTKATDFGVQAGLVAFF